MPTAARQRLREIYAFRCGYCGVSEADAGAELTVDHYQPLSQGGVDDDENRVYCCFACNTFKGDAWSDGPDKPVLHPLRDDLQLHLRLSADFTLLSLTDAGERHIAALHLNRVPLVAYRREIARRAANQMALQHALDEQESLRRTVGRLKARVAAVERRLRNA